MKSVNYNIILAALAVMLSISSAGQVKDRQHADRLESARKLFYSGSYYAAEKAFSELGQDAEGTLDKSEIEAYKVMCAIALDKVNASGLVKVFCDKYPNSPQSAMVRNALASRYFDTGHYVEALSVFNTINRNHIYRNGRTGFTFKKAYCEMRTGGYDKAIAGFKEVISANHSNYTVPATYYLGYVYYMQKDFKHAVPYFEKVGEGNEFSLMAKYFTIESKFMLKDYNYVVNAGPALFDSLDRDMQGNLARILSESYLAKDNTALSQKYLDLYKQSGAELTRKDHYLSGILAYRQNAYKSAVESFAKVLGTQDELGQNANYYSAFSYLKCHNKIAALDAFKAASECDFDKVIQEDALFNYATLCFDVNSDISQFRRYMKLYPSSGKDDRINGYMAASFLRSKDYASAIEALEAVSQPTAETQSNLQKAYFFRALQLADGKSYRAASSLFDKALDVGGNDAIDNLSRFWLVESLYRDERYDDAIVNGKMLLQDKDFRLTTEYPQAVYNQAYCYLKGGDASSAESSFRNYLNVCSEESLERDARIRLGDALFMQGKYGEAATAYENVYEKDAASNDIYPACQAALAYGLQGNDTKKISLLKQVTHFNRTAPLYPQALFELGRTYVQTGDATNASECFFTLMGMKDDRTFYAKSLIELALINANARKYDKAIEYYKTVVRDVPHSNEAQDALLGLESIYQMQNRPEDYISYLDEMGLSDSKSREEREEMIFASAQQLFLSGQYTKAINALQRFLNQYPQSDKVNRANYYLAGCLKETGRLESASDTYLKVMKNGNSDCSEDAARQYGDINYSLQHYQKAVDAYSSISDYAGMMRSYYKLRKYDEAISAARSLADKSDVSRELLREAKYIRAKSAMTLGDRVSSKKLLSDLSADCSDEFGAESAYLLITDAYDRGDFKDVEDRVYAFSDSGSGQRYWLAKSFIVLGDSFADRDDFEQAEATFRSILDGYKPQRENDDVVDQLKERLNLIKTMSR